MHKRARVALIAAALMVGAVAAGPSVVGATHGPKADGELTHAVQLNNDRIKFQTKDPVDVYMRDGSFAPNQAVDWHDHPGFVIVTVLSGTLTFVDQHCNAEVVGPGGAVVESGGPTKLVNGDAPATVKVTYVVPHGAPRLIPTEAPDCAG